MDPGRWREIERLYHAALARPVDDRAAFVAEACADDEALRREVEALLDTPATADGVFAAPAVAVAVAMATDEAPSVLTGRRLGVYQLQDRIGAGGMGEVYRARDTRLGRDVAIKILPRAFTDNADRLARFEREARVLAAFCHPNIATIHGIEESDGVRGLVMELVEGTTLAERIAHGPIPIPHALEIAKQIADALDAAHEKGIVHRDLKPANIKITPSSIVKVLDFGLAKLATSEGASSQAPTVTIDGTRDGMILGTAAYMSPEQARGQAVDKRTDIWAFGCVLYEMLTGRAAFAHQTVSDTIAAILDREPDWKALPGAISERLLRLMQRCLEKEPKRRLRDIGDVRIELEDVSAGSHRGTVKSGSQTTRTAMWAAAVVGTVVIAGVIVWGVRLGTPSGTEAPLNVTRFVIAPPEPLPLATEGVLTISPDGRQIAYVAGEEGGRRLYLRNIDQFDGRPIRGSEGADSPRFSPDGKWLAFVADRKLKKVPIDGGDAVIVTDFTEGRGLTWESTEAILFNQGRASGIWRVPASGGQPTAVTTIQQAEIEHDFPEVLPNGSALFFSVRGGAAGIGAAGTYQIYAQSRQTGDRHAIASGVGATYLPTGHLVYLQGSTLYALPFDSERLEPTGMPVALVQGVAQSAVGAPLFSVSPSGTLAYVATGATARRDALVWVDEQGTEQATAAAGREYAQPRLAPDGRRVAVTLSPGGGLPGGNPGDIWVYDLPRETWSRLTFDGRSQFPLWMPDGRSVTFSSAKNGPFDIYAHTIDGTSPEARIVGGGDGTNYPLSWSPDGEVLAYVSVNPTTANDIWVLQRRNGQTRPFLQTRFREGGPAFSPDGRWIAYASDRSGRIEVYMRPYPGSGEEWTISSEGGNEPVWADSPGRLFYRQGDVVMAVDVNAGPPVVVSKPRRLFQGRYRPTFGFWPNFDVTPDGKRFLMVKTIDEARAPSEINVVVNWLEELKRLVPIN